LLRWTITLTSSRDLEHHFNGLWWMTKGGTPPRRALHVGRLTRRIGADGRRSLSQGDLRSRSRAWFGIRDYRVRPWTEGLEGAAPQTEEVMKQAKYPAGWDEARVKRVLAHYERQSDEEAVAEDEAAYESTTHTAMEVPIDLVPAVRELLAKRRTG
jgi:hypothetical protein